MCELNAYLVGGALFGAVPFGVYAVYVLRRPSWLKAMLAGSAGLLFLSAAVLTAWSMGEPFPQVLMFCAPAEITSIAIGLGSGYALLVVAVLYVVAATLMQLFGVADQPDRTSRT